MGRALARTAVSSLALGVLSAFGDWIWARYIPDGAVLPGVIHGVVIFAALAVILGWASGRPGAIGRLLTTLPLAGLAIAALFYPLTGAMGYLPALLVTWILMWWTLAWLDRWARAGSEGSGVVVLRAAVAAVGSGLAFWSISGIWTDPSAASTNLIWRTVLWTWAFLPGFLALILGHRQD